MGENGSCGCSSSAPAEMTLLSQEEAAAAVALATGHCVADCLTLTTTPNSLHVVRMDGDCNQLTITLVVISSTVANQGVVLLQGSVNGIEGWTTASSYNFNQVGYVALSPPSTGFAFCYWRILIGASVGLVLVGNVCVWCTHE